MYHIKQTKIQALAMTISYFEIEFLSEAVTEYWHTTAELLETR